MPNITRRRFLACSAVASGAMRVRAGTSAGATPPDELALSRLTSAIKGRVVTPQSPDYESSRLVYNRAFDKRPALIVYGETTDDVARTLLFARQQNLPIAVRGGGHNRAGLSSCDGGVVIDLSAMNRVDVDAGRRIARVQAGALTVHVDAATQRVGLATPLAGCPTVGIAGLTLGGGEGFLMPRHGVTSDNLLSAQLVLADGRVATASQTTNPDLFWAIRGGGGNFGIATNLEYRLHSVGAVLAGRLTYSPGRINELVPAFVSFASALPDDIYAVAMVTASGRGPQMQVSLCHFGDPATGDKLLRPLRALGPAEDTVRVGSFLDTQATLFNAGPVAHFQTNLFLQPDTTVVATIVAEANTAPAGTRFFLQPFYGAVTRVAQSETAYPIRQSGFEVDIMGRWEDPADRPVAVRWVRDVRDKLRRFGLAAYVNQLGETSDELVRLAYGANYARLSALKRKYDPENILRSNQNVKPSDLSRA